MIRVVAAALFRGGRVLAARRRPDASRGGLWEFPGGKVEPGEDDPTALRRELEEELGLEVRVEDCLGAHVHDYGDIEIRLVTYAATITGGEPEDREHAELRWLNSDQLPDVEWAPADRPVLASVRARLS